MNAARPSKTNPALAKTGRDSDLESFRDIADDVIESDFVPYACLIDPSTLATKNGEVLQIIKITGLGFDTKRETNLRGAIRRAVQQCIPDESYALWLHTLRRRQQLIPETTYPDRFSTSVHRAWSDTHPASASFVNELYITIVKATDQQASSRMQTFMHSLRMGRFITERSASIDAATTALNATCERFVAALAAFGARRLGVVEREGVYHAEQLEFLEKLINLEERPMPLSSRDLSQVLTSGDITFGHSTMEVRTAEGKRRFACVLTLKEYKESTLPGIDKFLQIPCELIVSQCFDYIGAESARDAYANQARYLAISNDKELAQWMEIDRLTAQVPDARNFGQQQTTIFLIAPSVKQLEANVKLTQKALTKLGMVAIREDLRFEECYWAQLPGNFSFISRKQSVDTQHLAGFATLQTEPMGNAAGSPWGAPVSLLTTVQDAPYFFNFHRGNSAHTIVLGPPRSGRSSIAHFLLTQARALQARIWYLDVHGRAASFMREMGGTVATPGRDLALNPFALPDSPANREFLAIWLTTLIDPLGKQLTRAVLEFFQQVVAAVLQLPPEQRRISGMISIVAAHDAMLASQLQRWASGGEYGALFDHATDHFTTGPLMVWDIGAWADDPATRAPLGAYLLHRLTLALDTAPTVLVLDEGFALLDSPLFGMRASAWLDYVSQRNGAAMLMTDQIEASSSYAFTPTLAQKAASIFAMPDAHAGAEYALGFGISDADLATLHYMQPALRHVLLKRGEESTLLKMDLSSLGVLLSTLSGRAPVVAPQKSAADLLSELMGYGAPA